MDSLQLALFRRITLDYFGKLAPTEPPELDPPYMQFGQPALLDYASLVRIRGELRGCLYLTTTVAMLRQLLALNGEAEVSERTLFDMCRELANVLSGNASQAFGGNWEIAVPESLPPSAIGAVALPPSAFVMPFSWRGATSLLVIGLEPTTTWSSS